MICGLKVTSVIDYEMWIVSDLRDRLVWLLCDVVCAGVCVPSDRLYVCEMWSVACCQANPITWHCLVAVIFVTS